MAKKTQKALQFLAEEICSDIREALLKKPVQVPYQLKELTKQKISIQKKIDNLAKKRDIIGGFIKDIEKENNLVHHYNVSGFTYISKETKDLYVKINTQSIFKELVLLNEFTDKDLEEIKKEIVSKYLN